RLAPEGAENEEDNTQPPRTQKPLIPAAYSSTTFPPPVVENRDCDYLKLVMSFKRTLMLPDAFFVDEPCACYCTSCQLPVANAGLTNVLKNWVRFPLNQLMVQGGCVVVNTVDDFVWTTAYYNTRVDKIRSVLDHGQPLPIETGQLHPDSSSVTSTLNDNFIPGTHILLRSVPDASEPVNTTAPSNSGSSTRGRPFPLRYMVNGQFFHIKTAFEVRVRTQAISAVDRDGEQSQTQQRTAMQTDSSTNTPVGGGSSTSSVAMAPLVSNVANKGNNANDFTFRSWTTKEVDACVLTALLIHLIPN
uniref:Uncharacterized protein n=1 Tax=Anopheles maculatus TaxID=74869 RepID=A0A182SMY1_9DIPT